MLLTHLKMIKKTFSLLVTILCSVVSMAQAEADFQQVYFRVGSCALNAGDIPQALVDSANAAFSRHEKFTVLGVASPEGSYQSNERLATRRAKAIVKQLSKLTGVSDSMFAIKTKVADMGMLKNLVMQDAALPDRDKVLEILNDAGSDQALLSKLKRLGDGTPYLYIKDRLFPYLRASVSSGHLDVESYQPNLADTSGPKITYRDYRTRLSNQPQPDIRSAVTQNTKSRHSSSNGDNFTPPSPAKDSVKADSAKSETPSDSLQTSKIAESSKLSSEEKSGDSNLLFWIIIILLLLALLAFSFYHKWKVEHLKDRIAELESQLETAVEDTKKNVKTDLYNDGESLYNHLLIGGSVSEWTNDQIRALIEHYKLQNYPLVHSLETDYDNLPLNHILFEILLDMGKSDSDIQRMMNITQATIRSYRFRIKNKKLS